MSDNAIRVGDLVCVVRFPCCGACLGVVMTVTRFLSTESDYQCSKCKHWHGLAYLPTAIDDTKIGNRHFPLSWLRRIPPLWELDEAERKQEEKV